MAGHLIRRLVGRRGRAGGHNMLAGGWLDGADLSEKEREQLELTLAVRFLRLVGHKEAATMRPLLEDEEVDGV